MQRFICAIISMFALAHAAPYGSSSGDYGVPAPAPAPAPYNGQVVISYEPPVLYQIPAPSAWNLLPARHAGPALRPVDAYHISSSGTPGSLIGISSQPSAIAAAASANVPLNAGSYKLLVVPSYKVPNVVGPTPPLPPLQPVNSYGGQSPAAPSNGGQPPAAPSNGGQPSAAPSYGDPSSSY